MRMDRMSRGEKIFQAVNIILLVLFALVIILPILFVVIKSFVGEAEIARRGQFILIPEEISWSAYQTLWGTRAVLIRAYGNTMFRLIVGTSLSLFSTIGLAWGLSRRELKGRKLINSMVAFTMLFSGGMIPTYMVVRTLGLINTRLAMVLPGMISAWNMFMMRNFFSAIPETLIESADLDGANQLQTLVLIVLPCSLASIATIGLFYAVAQWNAWFDSMLYITDTNLLPMQNILRNIVVSASLSDMDASAVLSENYAKAPTESLRSATIIVSTLPILLVYPFIQKYFVKGVMVGSVKG